MKNSYLTVTDQFCGAGGSSEGVMQVARKKNLNTGLQVKMALNHWALAIETHNTNHPDTDHDCTDISACDPRRYPSTDILITSPECTNHSLAKGKRRKFNGAADLFATPKAEEERSRATMWDVPRFAEYHKYRIIIVENVVDARSWVQFPAWLLAMDLLGYDHQCVYLNSMHTHPTPQSRDRMYVVFWRKGNKRPDLAIRPKGFCNSCMKETETFQSWKNTEKKSGKYRQQYIFRCPTCNHAVEPFYYAAFNAIDWSLPGTRIGDRKKALSENTVKRIQYGINKYWNQPQIITTRYTGGLDCRVRSAVDSFLPTQPADQSHAILTPMILNGEYSYSSKKVRDSKNNVGFTQTTRATNGVVMPFLIKNYGGNFHPKNAPVDINNPLGTVTCNDHHALISPKSMHSFLTHYYGTGNGASDIKEAAHTITTKDRSGLVQPGERPSIEDCYYRMLLPHEVKLGMGFRHDYKILGNSKEQVKQSGNAVTPPAMELLVERCVDSLS